MGIKNLNRFLRENCSKSSIKKVTMHDLTGKTIVIDTSIYLYKFISENALLENMYLMISTLLYNQVKPIFIFDGKSPPEKQDLLVVRRKEKKEAENKYIQLQTKMESIVDQNAKQQLVNEMEQLKRKFIRVRNEDIRNVKELMDAYGVNYYDAPAEADQLCAYFVNHGKAWACMTDDMDMFLYGAPYVLRNLSLMNQTVTLYDTTKILSEINMSLQHFCEIIILSGTDYNIHSNTTLYGTLRWYREYKKYCLTIQETPVGFYVWLLKNTKYIKDYRNLLKIYQIFQINSIEELKQWDSIDVPYKHMDMPSLRKIMEKDGFMFCDDDNG